MPGVATSCWSVEGGYHILPLQPPAAVRAAQAQQRVPTTRRMLNVVF